MRSAKRLVVVAALVGLMVGCNSRSLDWYTPVSLVDFLDACAGGRESPLCAPMKGLVQESQSEFVVLVPNAGAEDQLAVLRSDHAAVQAGSPTPVPWNEFLREVSRSNILRATSLRNGSYVSLAGETVEVRDCVLTGRPLCSIGDMTVVQKYSENPRLQGVYLAGAHRPYRIPEIYRPYVN